MFMKICQTRRKIGTWVCSDTICAIYLGSPPSWSSGSSAPWSHLVLGKLNRKIHQNSVYNLLQKVQLIYSSWWKLSSHWWKSTGGRQISCSRWRILRDHWGTLCSLWWKTSSLWWKTSSQWRRWRSCPALSQAWHSFLEMIKVIKNCECCPWELRMCDSLLDAIASPSSYPCQ